MSPELVFVGFNRCYQLIRAECRAISSIDAISYLFHPIGLAARRRDSSISHYRTSSPEYVQSKDCGIIRSVKKLSVLFAIALSFLCATSDGRARGQTFPGLPILNVKKIAFESRDAGASIAGLDGPVTNTTHGEISVIDAPNPNPRLLAKGQGPTWSPNAQKVAFCVSEESGLFRTEIINADGTGQVPLAAIKRDVCPSDWSPDGEKLALTDPPA